ncbi:MAG: HNH endonuclease [Brevundimonas sp.]|nr:HNH endonuclease [Brevundimonas sp.]
MSDVLAVHSQRPARREVAAQLRYALYRNDLRRDFIRACGYCGDDDERADPSTFHIDHFAPKKQFPDLTLTYANLVYACRFCNVSKSNHWIGMDPTVPNDGTQGFVDPCSDDYEAHLGRDTGGRIVAKTPLGQYIIGRLHLHLIRHELLWRARKARRLRDEIAALIAEYKVRAKALPEYAPLLDRYYDLTRSIEDYEFRAIPR